MEFKPHAYQRYCIDRILDTDKLGLFLDMGLGKTVITLTAIKELQYNRFAVNKVLVIAPKSVAASTWTVEAGKWDHLSALRISVALGSRQQRVKALCAPADIYVINRENVVWLVDYYRNDWPFNMVVLDESSSFKNPRAQRFRAIKRALPRIHRLVELTGTPAPNGMEGLWSQVYLLDGGDRLGKHFTGFRERYFDPGRRGNGVVYDYNIKQGAQGSILERISDICVSMQAKDYISLPALITNDITVTLDHKALRSYTELERQMVLSLPRDEEDISVTSATALSNKLLQLSNGAVYDDEHIAHEVHGCKLQALTELAESMQGKPVLVFYNFRHDKVRISKALTKINVPVRELKTSEDIEAWNTGAVPVMLAHPASTAYGLNLQAGGHHIVWFGLTWDYELYSQAIKRLHRQGQTDRVYVHRLVCAGTRDEDVIQALGRKDGAQQYVMDSLKARIRKYRVQ